MKQSLVMILMTEDDVAIFDALTGAVNGIIPGSATDFFLTRIARPSLSSL